MWLVGEAPDLQPESAFRECPYMDLSSFARIPFYGDEVGVLTYIRPLSAGSSYRCRVMMGCSRALASLVAAQ